MDLDVGDVLEGRYKLIEVIGAGGHGTVYRAEDLDLGSLVAVKCMHPEVAEDPAFKARMKREARAMGALSGTSASQVFALNETPDGTLYIVMELLQGKDLETVLRELGAAGERMPLERVAALLGPIVDTLEAAHARGIIHRDLKPANIFVLDGSARGGVRLLDFGLVKVLKADPSRRRARSPGRRATSRPRCGAASRRRSTTASTSSRSAPRSSASSRAASPSRGGRASTSSSRRRAARAPACTRPAPTSRGRSTRGSSARWRSRPRPATPASARSGASSLRCSSAQAERALG